MQASSPRAREERITGRACARRRAAQPGQQPLDHAAVHRAQHGVGAAGVAEGALLGDHRGGLAPVLGVRREAVRSERLGHHVHGGAHRPLSLARRHARGQGASVLLADVRRHLLGLLGPEPSHRLAEEPHEEVVATLHEAELQLLLHAEVALGGAARAGGVAPRLDPEVTAVDQPLEVVAGHVRVQRESAGDLAGGHARHGTHVEEDVTAGRVAERGRDCGDGGAEPAVVRTHRSLGLHGDRSGAHPG